MDWGREITRTCTGRFCLRNGTSDHQHLLCKETSTQSHLQQWRTQFAGGLRYGEKTKNQGGGGYKGYCQ